MHPFQHILVPTDFEEPGERAASVAATLGAVVGARLTLVHVFNTAELQLNGGGPLPLDRLVAEAETLLRDCVVEAEEHGVEAEGLLLFGDPTTHILEAIEAREADLVVMGTHGRRGGARRLLGSVAEEVVRRSQVPAITTSSQVRDHDWLVRSMRVPRMSATSLPPQAQLRARPRFTPAND